RRLTRFLRLGLRDFPISHTQQLLYDFAPWRRLLIRDNQRTVRSLVNVIVLGLPLRNDSEPKKKGETRCKIQSRTSPPNADSTGLCPVSCNPGVFLRSTFLEGTEKVHLFVLPP